MNRSRGVQLGSFSTWKYSTKVGVVDPSGTGFTEQQQLTAQCVVNNSSARRDWVGFRGLAYSGLSEVIHKILVRSDRARLPLLEKEPHPRSPSL
jgi:hypothetical protein